MNRSTLSLTALLFALPVNALAQSEEELPFHDFRISGAVLLGGGHNASSGATLSANVGLSFFIPLVQNFGLRASGTFLSQPNLNASEGGGATLLSFGGGADYTIGFGDSPWGLGLAAGAEGAPWGRLDPGGFDSPGQTIRGVVVFQELALRRAIRVGIWEFGLRGDEFFGDARIYNAGVFFRFSFRI
jgi:hypothetical protein